jgi:hypothetical protein
VTYPSNKRPSYRSLDSLATPSRDEALEGSPVTQTLGDARSANMIRITGADGLAGAKGPMGGGGIKKYVQLLDSEAFVRS